MICPMFWHGAEERRDMGTHPYGLNRLGLQDAMSLRSTKTGMQLRKNI